MALAVDATTPAAVDDNATTTVSADVPDNALAVAFVIGISGSGTQTVTVESDDHEWTLAERSNDSTGATIEAWTTPVATADTFDVNVTHSDGATTKRVKVVYVTDDDGGIPDVGAVTEANSGNPISVTSTAIGSLVFGSYVAGSTSDEGAGQTFIDNDTALHGANKYSVIQRDAASTSIGETLSVALSITGFDVLGIEIVPTAAPPSESVTPDGVAIPLALGSPSTSIPGTAPAGVAVPVAFGRPTVGTGSPSQGMNLADVMDELATQLATIDGLRVAAFPDGQANPPCAIVAMPSAYDFDATYGRGSDTMTIPIVVLVSGSVPRTARNSLGAYCNGSGPSSIKQVLEAGEYSTFDTVRVASIEFDVYQLGAVQYPAAIFSCDIVGSGSGG